MFVTMFVWKCIKDWTSVNQQWLAAQFLVHSHEHMSLVSIYSLGMAILYLPLSLSSSFLIDPEYLDFLSCFVGEFHC